VARDADRLLGWVYAIVAAHFATQLFDWGFYYQHAFSGLGAQSPLICAAVAVLFTAGTGLHWRRGQLPIAAVICMLVGHWAIYQANPVASWGWFRFLLAVHAWALLVRVMPAPDVGGREAFLRAVLELLISCIYLQTAVERWVLPGWWEGDALVRMLSDATRSRWAFVDWRAWALVLKPLSYGLFFTELLLAGLWLFPARLKRSALWAVIVLHLGMELLLTEEFWHLTMVALAVFLLRAPPVPRMGRVAMGVFSVVALLQLQLSIPRRLHPPAMRDLVDRLPGLKAWWLRDFSMNAYLPAWRYSCAVIVGEKGGVAQRLAGGSQEECGGEARWRWRNDKDITINRLLLRHPQLDRFLIRTCRSGEWERLTVIQRLAPQGGGPEKLVPWECGDCRTMKMCEDAPDQWVKRSSSALGAGVRLHE
jgi:hypothetical protein